MFPGLVLGLAIMVCYLTIDIGIYGTLWIMLVAYVTRFLPYGMRYNSASMLQIHRELEESAAMSGASWSMSFRRVVLPLLKPALVTALVYSFVRAMTAVSAVIFLVSAQHNMATAYIVGRAEAGEFGLAIAYSSVLIVIMLAAIGLIQLLVGERRLGRRTLPAGELAIEGAG